MSARPDWAAVVAVGDELVEGRGLDTNSASLARRLAGTGRRARRFAVVGDEEEAIAAVVEDLAEDHGLVVLTGGLGPTLDDLTRHALARAARLELVESPEAWEQIRAWFERAGRELVAANRRQALLPRGAALLENRWGTAPGFRLAALGTTIFALPGPPRELEPMVETHLLPWLAARPVAAGVLRERTLHLFDLSESVFAERAGAWMERGANPRLDVTFRDGVLSAHVLASGAAEAAAEELLEMRCGELRARFPGHVFGEEGDAHPAAVLGRTLLERRLSVTCAESCTGGLVAGALTRVPGISEVFEESYVTYSDAAKTRLLGVPAGLLARHGAVSREVAEAMARGAAERSGADLALGVTGIAGPGGGSAQKPVGLVWFGTSFRGAVQGVERRWPDAGRDRVRAWATTFALGQMLRALGKGPG